MVEENKNPPEAESGDLEESGKTTDSPVRDRVTSPLSEDQTRRSFAEMVESAMFSEFDDQQKDQKRIFEQLLGDLKEEHRPVGETENALVVLVASDFSRLLLLYMYEGGQRRVSFQVRCRELKRAYGEMKIDFQFKIIEGQKLVKQYGYELAPSDSQIEKYRTVCNHLAKVSAPLNMDDKVVLDVVYRHKLEKPTRPERPDDWQEMTKAHLTDLLHEEREVLREEVAGEMSKIIRAMEFEWTSQSNADLAKRLSAAPDGAKLIRAIAKQEDVIKRAIWRNLRLLKLLQELRFTRRGRERNELKNTDVEEIDGT